MKTTTLSLLEKEINKRFQSKGEKKADWEAFLDYVNNLNKANFQIFQKFCPTRASSLEDIKFEFLDEDGERVPQDYFIGIEFDDNFILDETSCSEGSKR